MRLKKAAIFAALACLSIVALAACDNSGIPVTPTAPVAPTTTPVVPFAPTETPIVQVNLPTPGATVSPTAAPFGPQINITRKDYDEAIAKWNAVDVREYEVIANFGSPYSDLSGDWRLRVRDGKIVQIWRKDVEVFIDDGRGIPNPEANPDTLGFLTIKSQFEDIKTLLDDPSSMYLTIGGEKFEMQYDIRFNAELGYPEWFYSNPMRITDNSATRQIKQFRVIEQGPNATVVVTPGPALKSPTPRVPQPTSTTAAAPTQEVIIEKDNPEGARAYSEAAANWLKAGVTGYEIKARIISEGQETSWSLNVKDRRATILATSLDGEVTEGDYKAALVDEQYNMMLDVLAGNDDSGIEAEGQKFYITYAVEFDPDLGYPTRFEMRLKPGPVMDLGYVVIVDEFKVITKK
ncbi:MAG: hypothetical protein ABIQ44_15545 [Chloroflexia bacterium]